MKIAITKTLMETFVPTYFNIIDESHLHAKHYKGPTDTGTHFNVTLVSDDFENINKVKRHQMVYNTCKRFFSAGMHALALHLYDTEEWRQKHG